MDQLVPDFILRRDAAQEEGGSFSAAALFIDIPGFTRLTEALMRHGRAGAEALASALRFYFDPLIAAVHEASGFVASFAGDAFTAIFPESGAAPGAAAYALRAALTMRRFVEMNPVVTIGAPAPLGAFPFSFKIGLAWGEVDWGIVPVSASRRFFYFHGLAIEACTRIEQRARGGEIVLDPTFVRAAAVAGMALPVDRATEGSVVRVGAIELPRVAHCVREPPPSGVAQRFVDPSVAAAPELGEFRNVTSVFLSFDAVPSFPELIRRLHELASLYGGTFTGVDAGDKGVTALVLFGAPVAHENDVERALDFALAMRAAIGAARDDSRPAAPRLDASPRSPGRVRAGITYDVRYAGFNGGTARREFACLGRATNLAARLMAVARWGEIWCDDELAAGKYQWRPQGARRFKGFARAIPVVVLDGRRVVEGRHVPARGPLGRDLELARIRAALARVCAGERGPARVVRIEGEAGLGKSYLVERARRELDEAGVGRSLLWLDARCDQTLQGSLNAFEYALRSYLVPAPSADREIRRARFDDALDRLASALPAREGELSRALVGARLPLALLAGVRAAGARAARAHPPSRRKVDEALAALGVFFRAECAIQPVVLHVEDAHWADEHTWAALREVVRACRDMPLAVLITSRPRDDGTPVGIPLDPSVPVETVKLSPLAEEHIVALAAPLFGGEAPAMVAEILRDNAEGNPLYAQQILAYWLAERGHTMSSITNTFSPPRSITSLLVARLDRLDPELRATALAASVLGREFEARVLEEMLPGAALGALERLSASCASRPGRPWLSWQLRQGESQCLWSPAPRAACAMGEARPVPSEGSARAAHRPMSAERYRFTNVLLCNAAYEVQSRARLRELHRRAADAILRVHGDEVDDHLTALARHCYRAGDLERARPFIFAAARRAEERCAHAEARRLYRAYAKIVGTEINPRRT